MDWGFGGDACSKSYIRKEKKKKQQKCSRSARRRSKSQEKFTRYFTYGAELVVDDPLPHGFNLARGFRHLLRRLFPHLPLRFLSLLFTRFVFLFSFFFSSSFLLSRCKIAIGESQPASSYIGGLVCFRSSMNSEIRLVSG